MKILKIKPIILIAIFFFIMSLLIPLTGDDWTWKSEKGIQRLQSAFYNYNGRYISNVLEILSVRFQMFKILLMTLFSTLLIFFMSKIIFRDNANKNSIYVIIFVMIMPISIFQQTFGWVAGYVNYVISIVLVLYFILLFKNIFENNIKLKTWQKYSNTILAVFSMLFVEHVSLYLLFIGVLFNIILYVKYKIINNDYLSIFIGFIVGAIIMFSNKAYFSIFMGTDTYRTVGSDDGLITKMLDIFVYQMNYHFYVNNIIMILMIFIICLIIAFKLDKMNTVNTILLTLLALGPLFLFVNQKNLLEFRKGSDIYYFSSLIFIIFIITFIIYIIYNFRKENIFINLLFYLVSSIILTVPFLIITPYGGRAALGSIIFIILLLLELTKFILKDHFFTHLKILKFGIILLLTVSILYPLYENKKTELERNSIVSNLSNSEKSVKLPELPYPEFHQMPDPKENVYMTQFYKKIYDVNPEVKFIFKPN
ncbi:DUF6056 family protein [Staphylococcus cohnii]